MILKIIFLFFVIFPIYNIHDCQAYNLQQVEAQVEKLRKGVTSDFRSLIKSYTYDIEYLSKKFTKIYGDIPFETCSEKFFRNLKNPCQSKKKYLKRKFEKPLEGFFITAKNFRTLHSIFNSEFLVGDYPLLRTRLTLELTKESIKSLQPNETRVLYEQNIQNIKKVRDFGWQVLTKHAVEGKNPKFTSKVLNELKDLRTLKAHSYRRYELNSQEVNLLASIYACNCLLEYSEILLSDIKNFEQNYNKIVTSNGMKKIIDRIFENTELDQIEREIAVPGDDITAYRKRLTLNLMEKRKQLVHFLEKEKQKEQKQPEYLSEEESFASSSYDYFESKKVQRRKIKIQSNSESQTEDFLPQFGENKTSEDDQLVSAASENEGILQDDLKALIANGKQTRTFLNILDPKSSATRWKDLVSAWNAIPTGSVKGLGGSLHGFFYHGMRVFILHKPHPTPEIYPALNKRLTNYLQQFGITQESLDEFVPFIE